MATTHATPQFENIGSMITYQDEGSNRCLGYLMYFDGHGVYDANFGRVEISRENADTHNKLLDEAMLKGLEEHCDVGMHGTFYVGKLDGRTVVKTFVGTLVSADVTLVGNSLTFRRGGKTYRGRTSREADCFNFRRVA